MSKVVLKVGQILSTDFDKYRENIMEPILAVRRETVNIMCAGNLHAVLISRQIVFFFDFWLG